MASDIFRKAALERLSSPEQLDQLIPLTSPVGWAAAAALASLLAAVVAWGLLGSVPTRVQGVGIFVTRGGQVFDAMAPAAGTLTSVKPLGAAVRPGEVVAALDDTRANQDLQHAQAVLREQEAQLQQLVARFDREGTARQRVAAQQRQNLEGVIAAAEQRRGFYDQALRGEQRAAEQGFITRRIVQETRQQMEAAEQEARRARNDLLRIEAEELDRRGRRDQETTRQQEAVNAARRAIDELRIQAGRTTRVTSPIAGHVIEIKAGAGTVVPVGRPILSIETEGEGLELQFYVPPEHGKKIAPGMDVQIEPATVKKEEFGTLKGRVVDVSPFPVSIEGMMAVLQNAQLVSRFSAQGAPYAARIGLLADAGSPTGYAWSGKAAPGVAISSGTTAMAEITVRRQAPITLVMPLLRQATSITD